SREGTHDLAGFGPDVLAALRAGIPLLVTDAAQDPRTRAPESLAAFDAIDTRAAITASLVKDGRMRAALYVHARTPRPWTEHDIGLVIEVAERTWAAVERARAESRLRESESRFRTMSDDAPVMSWITDPSGVCTYLNRRWYEFTGQSPETAEGFGWLDAVHPDDRGWSGETFLQANARREAFRLEYRLRRRDGAYRWAIDAASPRFDANGEFLGYFGSVIDIHDRRLAETGLRELNETLESRVAERTAELMKAEEALRQAQKMEAVGQLTGGVAHDFNNLLTIIRSSVDFLRRPDLAEERRRRYVEAISDTVDRAAKLTGQLLAFARRQALKPELFDAAERLDNVTDMLRTIVGARIVIETELACDPCCVVADVSQFETALINMAVNARDAMEGEGTLTIRAEGVSEMPAIRNHAASPGHFVAVSLTDTGSGIPPDRLTQIFEPFYTTKEVGKGTGLGLSQVYGFAKQSGGDVAVSSTLGRGTTFTLYLPRADGTCSIDDRAAPGGEEAVEHGRGRRVLVVEDNLDVGRFATQILEDLGYETVWAANADEALSVLAGPARFDAVFSDVVMPGMSGVRLGQEIRHRHPDLPVVLTSGYSHVLAEEGRHGFELLQKPYAADELSRVLHRVIGGRRRYAPAPA
ncbi:PAS domain S-box protein, partial [Methylobacterium oryzisoli]